MGTAFVTTEYVTERNSVRQPERLETRALPLPEEERARVGEAAARRVERLRPGIAVNRLLRFYEDVIMRFRAAKATGKRGGCA